MSKKRKEPIEGLGPALNGLDLPLPLAIEAEPGPEEELWQPDDLEMAEVAPDFEPRVLIIGSNEEALATGALASPCGYEVAWAALQEKTADIEQKMADAKIFALAGFEDIIADCDIDRGTFVCIFLEDPDACELILNQCLASDAFYIGLAAKGEIRDEIFQALKEDGAPDAELAAIAAPMGLNIGADTPEQRAVAIVAEMLAARAGKLKKLRH